MWLLAEDAILWMNDLDNLEKKNMLQLRAQIPLQHKNLLSIV